MSTSIQTYYRGFTQPGSAAFNAGNYPNSCAALAAKFVLLLTGVGICIAWAIEKYCWVNPKVAEFTKDCQLIYQALARRKHDELTVTVKLSRGRIMSLMEISGLPKARIQQDQIKMRLCDADGNNDVEADLPSVNFDALMNNLRADMVNNREVYDLDQPEASRRFSTAVYDVLEQVVPMGDHESAQLWSALKHRLFGQPLPIYSQDLQRLLQRTLARLVAPKTFDHLEDGQVDFALTHSRKDFLQSNACQNLAGAIEAVTKLAGLPPAPWEAF